MLPGLADRGHERGLRQSVVKTSAATGRRSRKPSSSLPAPSRHRCGQFPAERNASLMPRLSPCPPRVRGCAASPASRTRPVALGLPSSVVETTASAANARRSRCPSPPAAVARTLPGWAGPLGPRHVRCGDHGPYTPSPRGPMAKPSRVWRTFAMTAATVSGLRLLSLRSSHSVVRIRRENRRRAGVHMLRRRSAV